MRNFVFVAIYFLLSLQAKSQETPSDVEIPTIIPPTPNAASLGNYGNIPIGLYTGQPNISFPLYTISYNDISVPIALSYNYSGLKVEEYPSWVGTGWTLTGTGVITRQVRGLPDETTAGYNGSERNGEKTVDFIQNGHYSPAQTPFLSGVMGGYKDSEPDMFVLSMPGHSAKFFFDEKQCSKTTKQAVITPHQKLKVIGYFNYTGIYNIRPGTIEKFEVTNGNGVVYTFDITEKAAGVEPGDPDEDDFANSWYLSKIVTPNGNEIAYEYADRILDMPPTLFERRAIPLLVPGQFPIQPSVSYSLKHNYISTNEKILKRIRFRSGLVDFIEGVERSDWNSTVWSPLNKATEQPKSLSKIRIINEGKIIKEVDFAYSYFGTEDRLRLDSFRERNGNTVNPSYEFYYRDGLFPPIGEVATLFHQDHWGYYLGSAPQGGTIDTLLPPYSDSFEQSNGSMFVVSVPGNLRTPNHFASAAGILESIKYPTGGVTEFEYEPNDYWGLSATQFNLCSGDFELLDKALISFNWGSPAETKQFIVTTPTCMKFDYTLSVPCIDGEAGVKIEQQGGSPIMHHIVSNKLWGLDYSDYGPNSNEYFSLQPGTYLLTAWGINENTCGAFTEAAITLSHIVQNAIGEANFKAGGMRVKRVRDCDVTEECITKYYEYKDPLDDEKSSGVLINSPVYQYYQLVRFDHQNVGMPTVYYDINHSMLTAHSQIPIASSLGAVIGYKNVVVAEEINGTKGKTEYSFTSASEYPDVGIDVYPFPPKISNDWKRGAQLFKKIYKYLAPDQSVVVLNSSSVPCLTNVFSEPIGLKPRKLFENQTSIPSTLYDYDFISYTLESGWLGICSQDQTSYSYHNGVQQSLTTQKNMFYENPDHLQVTRIETTNSNGEVLKSTYKYVEDVNEVAGLSQEEQLGISSHQNKMAVIEEQQYNGPTLITTKRSLYANQRMKKVQFSTGNNPLEDHVNFNAYDNFNNVLNYTTRTGENKSYIWDVNGMYPLVEAVNANHTDIFFTSFEVNGQPFVDENGNNKSISGTRVWNTGSFTFPASFMPSDPANTLMSYWYWQDNQWNFSGEIPYTSNIVTGATKLDEVRAFPKGAQLTTLTYEPGVGANGITDANNQSMHYEYDLLGRLQFIRDHDGNILKEFKYHYQEQE